MKEIEANKRAWAQLSREHYETFKKAYEAGEYALNAYIQEEVGDLKGKKLLHLQCNTGADSIALSRMGAREYFLCQEAGKRTRCFQCAVSGIGYHGAFRKAS